MDDVSLGHGYLLLDKMYEITNNRIYVLFCQEFAVFIKKYLNSAQKGQGPLADFRSQVERHAYSLRVHQMPAI